MVSYIGNYFSHVVYMCSQRTITDDSTSKKNKKIPIHGYNHLCLSRNDEAEQVYKSKQEKHDSYVATSHLSTVLIYPFMPVRALPAEHLHYCSFAYVVLLCLLQDPADASFQPARLGPVAG